MTHELKIWPAQFSAILAGEKTFEVRHDDRPYQVGDTLHLREWNPSPNKSRPGQPIGYTGAELRVEVSYVLRQLPPDGTHLLDESGKRLFAVMGFRYEKPPHL